MIVLMVKMEMLVMMTIMIVLLLLLLLQFFFQLIWRKTPAVPSNCLPQDNVGYFISQGVTVVSSSLSAVDSCSGDFLRPESLGFLTYHLYIFRFQSKITHHHHVNSSSSNNDDNDNSSSSSRNDDNNNDSNDDDDDNNNSNNNNNNNNCSYNTNCCDYDNSIEKRNSRLLKKKKKISLRREMFPTRTLMWQSCANHLQYIGR